MQSITLTCPSASVTKIIPLQEYRLYRRSSRSRLEYKNGGGESVYHGWTYYLELRWQYLSLAEYNDIIYFIDLIRYGNPVRWDAATGFTYFQLTFPNPSDMFLEIDSDEIVEAQGEWFEKMPFEVTFFVKRAVTGIHNGA